MFDYRNQALHPLLDRNLGTAVLEFILNGKKPVIATEKADQCAAMLEAYAKANWQIEPGRTVNGVRMPMILTGKSGEIIGLWVIHPLEARPRSEIIQAIIAEHNLQCAIHTSFDLERRPFWVMNHLV